MATYIDFVKSQKPLLFVNTTGSTIEDLSDNAASLNIEQGVMDYTTQGFYRSNELDRGFSSAQSSGYLPFFLAQPTSNNFTISFWVRGEPDAVGGYSPFCVGSSHMHINYHPGGVFGPNSFANDSHGISGTKVYDGKWHHIVFTGNYADLYSTTRCWLDGIEQTVIHTAATSNDVSSFADGSIRAFRFFGRQVSGAGSADTFDTKSELMALGYWDSILTDEQIVAQYDYHPNTQFDDPLSQAIHANRPFAWYKFFNDDPTATVIDISGAHNHMDIVGGYTRKGDALYLTPNNGYAETVNTSVGDPTAPLAYEMWLEFHSYPTTGARAAFAGHANTADNWNEGIQFSPDGVGSFLQFNGPQENSPGYNLKLNQLHHVVVVRDTAGRKVYIDGNLVFTLNNANDPVYSSARLVINKNWSSQATGDSHWMDATIHEFVYYDQPLSAEDVTAHYAAGIGALNPATDYDQLVLDKNPVAYFPISVESAQTDKLIDVSGNSRTMAIPAGGAITNGLNGGLAFYHATSVTPTAICDVPSGLDQYTAELWVHTDARSGAAVEIPFSVSNGTYRVALGFHVSLNVAYMSTINATGTVISSSGTVPANDIRPKLIPEVGEWMHIVTTVDHTTGVVDLWLNGAKVGRCSVEVTGMTPSNTKFAIGNLYGDSQYGITGKIQHPAFYDRILTDEEIREHFAFYEPVVSNVNNDYMNLVMQNNPIAYYPITLDSSTATQLFDASGNGHHMQFNPTASATGVGSGSVVDTGINNERAFYCNGNAPNVAVPELGGKQQVTLEGWFHSNKQTEDGFYDVPFSVDDTTTSNNYAFYGSINNSGGTEIWRKGTYHIAYIDGTQSTPGGYLNASAQNMVQTWRHFCMTVDLSTGKSVIWVDGEPVYATFGDPGFTFPATMAFSICGRVTSTDRDGKIQHAALYDKILTRDEIKARFEMYREVLQRPAFEPEYNAKVMEKNPILYTPCHNNLTTTMLVDVSGNSNHALIETASGSRSLASATGVDSTPAYTFSDASGSATLAKVPQIVGATKYTLETWIKFGDLTTSSNYWAFGIGESTGSPYRNYLVINNTGLTYMFNGNKTNSSDQIYVEPTPGKWYHVAMVIDHEIGVGKLYINGVMCAYEEGIGTSPPAFTVDNANVWFDVRPGGSTAVTGATQHTALYDRLLTQEELREHYELRRAQSEFDVGTYEASVMADNPLNYWIMDETGGSTVIDHASAMHGVINGTTADLMQSSGLNQYLNPEQTAFEFTGAQWIDCGDWSNYHVRKGFSVEGIVYFDQLPDANKVIVGFADGGGFTVTVDDTGQLIASIRNVTDDGYDVLTGPIVLGGVSHFALTFTGQTWSFFVNGTMVQSADMGAGYTMGLAANRLTLGADWDAGGAMAQHYTGKMGHIAMYDHVIPASSIRERAAMILGHLPSELLTYANTVLEDAPHLYIPFNNKESAVIQDMGNSDTTLRHGRLYSGDTGAFVFESDSIVSGGGPSLYTNATELGKEFVYFDEEDIVYVMGGTAVTYEMWVKFETLDPTNLVYSISSGESNSSNVAMKIYPRADGSLYIFWEHNAGTNWDTTLFPAGTFVTGKTYHLVVVRTATTLFGYLNGKLIATETGISPPTVASIAIENRLQLLGARDYPSDTNFHGWFSHFALYDYALTDDRILAHYLHGSGIGVTSVEGLSQLAKPTARFPMTYGVIKDENSSLTYTHTGATATDGLYKGSPGAIKFPATMASADKMTSTLFSGKTVASIEMWVQFDGTNEGTSQYMFAAMGGTGAGSTDWRLILAKNSAGVLSVNWYSGASMKSEVPVPTGSPVHIAYVRDGATQYLYMNGEQVAVGACPATAFGVINSISFGHFAMSYYSSYGYFPMSGSMDNVLLDDTRAFTAAEIKDRYEAGVQGTYFERFLNGNNCSFYAPFNEMPPVDKRTGQVAQLDTGGTLELIKGTKSPSALAIGSPSEIHFTDKTAYEPYTSAFTVAIWVKFNGSTGSSQRIIEKKGLGTAEGWQLCTGHGGDADFGNTFMIGDSLVQHRMATNDNSYNMFDGQWHHVAMVLDRAASEIRLYWDGVLTETIAHAELATVNIDNAGYDLRIGGAGGDTSQQLNGAVDEAFIFKKALTEAQVKQLMKFSEPGYKVGGNVSYDGNPAERTVRVYNRATGELMQSVMSNRQTGAFEAVWNDVDPDNQYYVVVMDDTPKPDLDPLVKDRVSAEVIEEQ